MNVVHIKCSVLFQPPKMFGCAPKTFYSIEAPGVLRSNAVYTVAINLFDAPEACDVKISLSGGELNVDKVVKVHPWSTRMLSFEIPNLKITEEDYYLEAECLEGAKFKKKTQLLLEKGEPLIYIQCDKKAYKQNDNVDFRIIILETNLLRPISNHKSTKMLIKHSNNVVLEKSNLKLHKGIYTGQWPVPNDAPHGLYDIEVYYDDELIKSKSFEIIDFKPPKFSIKINTPKILCYPQKHLIVGVEANTFDGDPIEGICKMEIETVGGYFSGVYLEKCIPINGRIEYTIIDFVDDLKFEKAFESGCYTEACIMIEVTITNDKTNEQETFTELITMKKSLENDKDENAKNKIEPMDDNDLLGRIEYRLNGVINNSINIVGPQRGAKGGDILDFTIEFKKPTNHIGYVVTSRGNIIESEFIKVENNDRSINIKLESTFQYVPKAFLFAYFVLDRVLYFDEIRIDLLPEFVAKLKVTAPEFSKPGSLAPIEIETEPNSLVALMAIDEKSVLLHGDNDLSYKNFFYDVQKIRSRDEYVKINGRYAGLFSGLVTLSNVTFDGFDWVPEFFPRNFINDDPDYIAQFRSLPPFKMDKFKNEIIKLKQKQEQIFGNWFFVNKESDKSGQLKIEMKLPENPTTWLITAFAISDIKGFTMLKEPLKIKTLDQEKTKTEQTPTLKDRKIETKTTEIFFENYSNEMRQRNYTLETPLNGKILEISFNITENLFGPAIAHLNDHAGIMYEAGHFRMTTIIPNITVLEYLDHLNQLDTELALSIKARFPEVIEREQPNRCDGSFSWFHDDPIGSPHMTSLVLQAFQRAAKYVEIEPDIIKKGLDYLVSQQLATGAIAEEHHPFLYPFQEKSAVGLTSTVLLAFLLDEQVKTEYADFINKSFDYIIANLETIDLIYDLAVAFYAMQLARHPYAENLKARIFELAKTDPVTNKKWWQYAITRIQDHEIWTPVNELEITATILLGLLETESIETLLPIIKWILTINEFPNERMDRNIASEAILKMAIKCGTALGTMDVFIKAFNIDNVYLSKIQLTPKNSARTLMHVLPPDTRIIRISSQDNGTFVGNITQRYEVE